MTKRTYTIEKKNPQHNQIWEWEETPELLAALEQLEKSSQAVKDIGKLPNIHVANSNPAPIKKKSVQ